MSSPPDTTNTARERPGPCAVDGARWARSLTLMERVSLLEHIDRSHGEATAGKDRWRQGYPYRSGFSLAQRLRGEGLTEDSFDRALLASPEELARTPNTALSWVADFLDAYSGTATADAGLPAADREHQTKGLLVIAGPLIARARCRLRDAVRALLQRHPAAPISPDTADDLLTTALAMRLTPIVMRTMSLELNVARLQDRLQGDSPEQRFRSFLAQLAEPRAALSLLEEYPVLARQMHAATGQCVSVTIELLSRLVSDWSIVQGTFFDGTTGPLLEVQSGLGDTHRGGRSVALLTFASGQKLVYKPRSLMIDQGFQDVLRWANSRGLPLPFRTMRLLDRGDYGWAEFVETTPCDSADQARRFYFRQGANLALLYALHGSDIHHENVLAAGEHPVLVDLETLFAPSTESETDDRTDAKAARQVADSVLQVGLLPMRVWGGAESEGIDVSGLVDSGGLLTPDPVPTWQRLGSDEMHMEHKRMPMMQSGNVPELGGDKLDVCRYSDELLSGFEGMYRLLIRHRDELLAPGGLIDRFREHPIRVVLRMSQSYATMLHDGSHPDVLRDGLERDRLIDRLWGQVATQPELAPVVALERRELHDGDLPVFTSRPASRAVWSGRGERVAEFFTETGLERVRRRIEGLSEADLTRQRWFIVASLATREPGAAHARRAEPASVSRSGRPSRDELLSAASDVADRLEVLAIHTRDEVTWSGLVFGDREYPFISSLALDLYEGIPGVALFLGRLGAVLGNPRFVRLAEAGLRTTLGLIERTRDRALQPGGFYGLGGVVYALTHFATMWDREDLLDRAEQLALRVGKDAAKDEAYDVILGCAGGIAVLLGLYQVRPTQRILDAARQCGDRLVEAATERAVGAAWSVPKVGRRPLTGASHGAGGIAWALLWLAAASGDDRYRATASAAIEYERSCFDAERGNWPDYRHVAEDVPEEARWGVQWCHGAPGVGLVRALGLPYLDDPQVRTEIAVAARTTLEQGFGFGHCLCHGDFGNLECLSIMASALGDRSLAAECDRLAGRALQSVRQNGWICGVPRGVETPSLLTGVAGIGYGLLRLAEPEAVPSILSLQPPRKTTTPSNTFEE